MSNSSGTGVNGPRNPSTATSQTTTSTTTLHANYATGLISAPSSKSQSQSTDDQKVEGDVQPTAAKPNDDVAAKGETGKGIEENPCSQSQQDAGSSSGILSTLLRGKPPTDAEKIVFLERQVKDQKNKIKDLSNQLSEKLHQNEAYRATNQVLDTRLRQAETRVLDYKSDVKYYKDHNDALKYDISNLEHHIRVTLDKHIRGLDEKIIYLERKNNEMQGSMDRELQRSKRIEEELDKSRGLAETRRLELKGSENFLTKADVLAASDVKKMVEELNDEIYQTSATMTEENSLPKREAIGVECKPECKALEAVIGVNAVELLRHAQPDDHVFVLQTTLQACMIYWASKIVPCWNFDIMEIQTYLDTVYKKLREEEEQAVAGRWRALTRAQLYSVRADKTDIPSKAVSYINESLINVMIVAGYDRKVAQDHIWRHIKNAENVARLSLDLNKTMGEKFTSADLEVVTFRPGAKFDAGVMEDANESPSSKTKGKGNEGRVLCMSSLGMGQKEGKPKQKSLLLLRPKVILDSIIQDLGAGGENKGTKHDMRREEKTDAGTDAKSEPRKDPKHDPKNDPKTILAKEQTADATAKASGMEGDKRAAG